MLLKLRKPSHSAEASSVMHISRGECRHMVYVIYCSPSSPLYLGVPLFWNPSVSKIPPRKSFYMRYRYVYIKLGLVPTHILPIAWRRSRAGAHISHSPSQRLHSPARPRTPHLHTHHPGQPWSPSWHWGCVQPSTPSWLNKHGERTCGTHPSQPGWGDVCNYANLRRRLPVETKDENVSIPD